MKIDKIVITNTNFSSPQFIPPIAGGVRGVFLLLFLSVAAFSAEKLKLIILHTNDTHSQVEPTENSTSNTANMGGYARRMGVIDSIRSAEKNVLLVDAGDFSQGTPYFNFYNGRVEIDALNRMKYDAITLGNHEFDNGIDTLAVILKQAKVPVLSTNYSLEKTLLHNFLKPYLILKRGGLRIGIITANIEPKGLIIESNYKGLIYNDAQKTANEVASFLKHKKHCDIIICLSHLGVKSDYELAGNSNDIDVIVGGHSHSLLENVTAKNASGKSVIIAQIGKSGLYLGKIVLEIESK